MISPTLATLMLLLNPNAATSMNAPGPTLKWSAEVGKIGFRGTLHVAWDSVVVGSNGKGPKIKAEEGKGDPLDGVFVLDLMKGTQKSFFRPPGRDELDVNGVAIDGETLIFGTDQGMLYKMDREGKVLWKSALNGDIEGAPALGDFNRDKVLDIAVGAEDGDLYLIDGRGGAVIKSFPTGQGPYEQMRGFLASFAVHDVTGDGVPEVFAPGRDGGMRAIDGASGELLWSRKHDSALHSAPVLADTDNDGRLELVYTACYSTVVVVDAATGETEWTRELEHPDIGIEGLFSNLAWHPELQCVLVGTSWWDENEGLYCVGKEGVKWRYNVPSGRISSGAVIADVDHRPGAEILFGTESGTVVALNSKGEEVWVWKAGGAVECTPTVLDIDQDGLNEVLFASLDGRVQALDTPGRERPILPYSRVSLGNQGAFLPSGR